MCHKFFPTHCYKDVQYSNADFLRPKTALTQHGTIGVLFFLKFLLDRGPFCGATGTFCFGLRRTLFPDA